MGENLAWGAGANRSVAARHRGGLDGEPAASSQNILNARFREIGIGVVEGRPRRNVFGLPAATYATSFGSRG